MIKEAIVKIVNKGDLSYDEAYAVMNEIMSGETTPTQNAAFLAALSTKSARAETTDEIAGCAAAMRNHATKVDTGMDIFEIVGTGGDNAHSFNISTTSALVAAAGGMKVTTLAVLIANAVAAFRRREDPQLFHRRLEHSAVRNAAAILLLYLGLTFAGAAVISTAEELPLGACLYETASAAGTVGLTLGLTPQLGVLSQSILILLMYFGRVGGLTLIYAAFSGHDLTYARYPQEKITVG